MDLRAPTILLVNKRIIQLQIRPKTYQMMTVLRRHPRKGEPKAQAEA